MKNRLKLIKHNIWLSMFLSILIGLLLTNSPLPAYSQNPLREINRRLNSLACPQSEDCNNPGSDQYISNKEKLKCEVAQGGWSVAWGDDISEQDFVYLIYCGGVSISENNATAFYNCLNDLIQKTVSSLFNDQDLVSHEEINAKSIAEHVITDAVKSGAEKNYSTQLSNVLDFKAGTIKYHGCNCLFGRCTTQTGGLKPYVALKRKQAGNSGVSMGPGPGFYRQDGTAPVYLVYKPGSYCHIQNTDQLHSFGGWKNVSVVQNLELEGTNTGECPWPNGFFRRSDQAEVYHMYGDKVPNYNIGGYYCNVVSPDQLKSFGGWKLVQEVSNDSDLGVGRNFMGGC